VERENCILEHLLLMEAKHKERLSHHKGERRGLNSNDTGKIPSILIIRRSTTAVLTASGLPWQLF